LTYYDRKVQTHLDGTPIFKSAEDEAHEDSVAREIEEAFACQVRSFGRLALVDWYAIRDGRMVAVLELKSRTHSSDTYPTVFLNVRKWLALTQASLGLGVHAIYVVRFTDATRWVSLTEVDATKHAIGGTLRIVKSRNDIEPVIHVPVSAMSTVIVRQAA
jgi:hypothetical protein